MKIRIDDTIYEGTGAEILEQLRLAALTPLSSRIRRAISGSSAATSSA